MKIDTDKIEVCCTGSCFWQSSIEADGGVYVVNNETPSRLQFYTVEYKTSEDLYMDEDMIFDIDLKYLTTRTKAIYEALHNKLEEKADEWGFWSDLGWEE